MTTPKNSQQLIDETAADHDRLRDATARWSRLQNFRFADHYYQGLRAAGVPEGKADEIHAVLKQQINKVAESLETASYFLLEIAGEVEAARKLVRNEGPAGSFRI